MGVAAQDPARLAAPRHVVDVPGAPFAGKQALAEMDDIEPQEACKADLGALDLDIGVGRQFVGRDRRAHTGSLSVGNRRQVRIGLSSSDAIEALSISTTHRSGARWRWRAV